MSSELLATSMLGARSRSVTIEFSSSVNEVIEQLEKGYAGCLGITLGENYLKVVHYPGANQPVSVLEGYLENTTEGSILYGTIRWSRLGQCFLCFIYTFLGVFCFGVPALMLISHFLNDADSSGMNPLLTGLLWAALTFTPFHFLLKYIYKSRLPQIRALLPS